MRIELRPDLAEMAARAKAYGLELGPEPQDYVLEADSEGVLTLRNREGLRLRIHFDDPGIDYHRRGSRGKQELLAKALGSKYGNRKILDLTAGLGQDSVFLSQIGFEVTALERNPLIAFLLSEAQRNTTRPELKALKILFADAIEKTAEPDFLAGFDAVYFDPMYPAKKKSALPRQEMRLFKELVGEDGDASKVMEQLSQNFQGRIVVKRPVEAEALMKPIHSFVGKTVRYDVIVRS